ncbi:MAG: hypothetical protein EP329_12070 [Deltaproteobacteria bacterium]|nr:MAG: hypothetical protein EP329_12070 [Deltaproteobacteria bacterium]
MTEPSTAEKLGGGKRAAVSAQRVIRRLLHELEGQRDLSRVRGIVETLQKVVPDHIKGKEAPGGLYDELRTINPNMSGTIDRLAADNHQLERELDELSRWIHRVEDDLHAMWQARHTFVRHLYAHERIESGAVADTYYLDLGTGD